MKPLLGAAMVLPLATGCMRVDATAVHVRDPRAVGVVSDASNTWLLPPGSPPGTAEVHRSVGGTASLARSASGAIEYTGEHWALGERVDTTALLDAQGRATWIGSASASGRLRSAIARGGEVRLHAVEYVQETGPFGTCNGTLFDSCITTPAVPMSLATDSRNIDEVRVVRTPMRLFGLGEVIFGAASLGVAAVDGAVLLPAPQSDARNVALGVGAGLVVLGGLAIANGLWRLLSPEEQVVYRPPLSDP